MYLSSMNGSWMCSPCGYILYYFTTTQYYTVRAWRWRACIGLKKSFLPVMMNNSRWKEWSVRDYLLGHFVTCDGWRKWLLPVAVSPGLSGMMKGVVKAVESPRGLLGRPEGWWWGEWCLPPGPPGPAHWCHLRTRIILQLIVPRIKEERKPHVKIFCEKLGNLFSAAHFAAVQLPATHLIGC